MLDQQQKLINKNWKTKMKCHLKQQIFPNGLRIERPRIHEWKKNNENKKSFRLESNYTSMHTISKAATTRPFIEFSFHAFAALYFHALRWPSSHASIPHCSTYTCLSSTVRMSKLFPCLRALENAEEINTSCFVFGQGGLLPPWTPQPGATAPDPRSSLPPAM